MSKLAQRLQTENDRLKAPLNEQEGIVSDAELIRSIEQATSKKVAINWEVKHAALEQAVKDALKQIDNNIVEFSQSGEHGWAGGVLYGMTLAANVIKQKTRL